MFINCYSDVFNTNICILFENNIIQININDVGSLLKYRRKNHLKNYYFKKKNIGKIHYNQFLQTNYNEYITLDDLKKLEYHLNSKFKPNLIKLLGEIEEFKNSF
jgi:hypothetical protein